MATMIDLLQAARAQGLPVEVTPDFQTNGHNGVKVQSPKAGYLHHTDARLVVSVYKGVATGWDPAEWRPDVPSPRCQVYAARARVGGCRLGCQFKGRAHLVFVTAGVAYQAGRANGARIAAAQRGQISASVVDAAKAGLADTMDANDPTMGVEIDWAEGEDWPADLLELVCQLMALAVTTFGWPGVGSWIRHRQATARKVDPQTNFDFWARAQDILNGDNGDMTADPQVLAALDRIGDSLDNLYRVGFASRSTDGKDDPTHYFASLHGVNVNLGQIESQNLAIIQGLADLNQTLAQVLEALSQPPADPPPATA